VAPGKKKSTEIFRAGSIDERSVYLGYMTGHKTGMALSAEMAGERFGLLLCTFTCDDAKEAGARVDFNDADMRVNGEEFLAEGGGASAIGERSELDPIAFDGGVAGRLDDSEANRGDAGTDQSDIFRGALGEVDDTAFDVGAAIGDADLNVFAIGLIEDIDPGAEGEAQVRGGKIAHVVDLTIGSTATVIRLTIPTGDTAFGIARLHGCERSGRSVDASRAARTR